VAPLLVDSWMSERPPARDLAGVLRCVWRGDLAGMRTPLPDECVDLVWIQDVGVDGGSGSCAGGELWLSGPESRSWTPPPTAAGRTAVGARFRPGAGPAVLRVAATDLRDLRVRLDEVWDGRAARLLAERVAARPDERLQAAELEAAVRGLLPAARPVDPVALEVAAGLDHADPAPVSMLARAAGLSERQLLRRTADAFGYGPSALARVLRVQRVLRLARRPRRPVGLAGLAASAGYVDQPHLAHEVRAVFGTTPAALLRPA
jgi:AraC-like DNA-binding protein